MKDLEKDIIEDLNKILVKLASHKEVKLSYQEEVGIRVPSRESMLEDWENHVDEDDEFDGEKYAESKTFTYTEAYAKWLEEQEKITTAKINKMKKDTEGVMFKEAYDNFNLSALKTLLKAFVTKTKLDGDEMESYINQYYNSNC